MNNFKAKKWVISVISVLIILVLIMTTMTYIVDPYFHFHKPLSGMSYRLYEQRYINDGIGRNFDYNAIITGNSLTENFKTTEFDRLFGVTSVKLPYSGAGYNEIWSSLGRALKHNDNTQAVIVALDFEDLPRAKDWVRYDSYPEYLYDDNPWNDLNYLLNKDVFYRGTIYNLLMTIIGTPSTTFDEYSSWKKKTGKDKVMQSVGEILPPEKVGKRGFSDGDKEKILGNIRENIIKVVKENPDTQFYLYFAPDSIAQWCMWNNESEIDYRAYGLELASQELTQYDNIHLFAFFDQYEWTCNLDNYNDPIHYTSEINSEILREIKNGEHQLTKDNYKQYVQDIYQFYSNYDYLSLQE